MREPHKPEEEGVRLAKRVAAQVPCSRSEAERYIEGGWVRVDGVVVEEPQFRVTDAQQVVMDKNATLFALMPVTVLLHKPPGYEVLGGQQPAGAHGARSRGAPPALQLLLPANHAAGDPAGIRVLRRHFANLVCETPLPTEASGLVVYTQDARIARKLAEDAETTEQECIVEVAGQIMEGGIDRLCHGLTFNGRALPPIKVSWQNETRLRFALKGIRPGQIPSMCDAVGLRVVALKRIRIGRVPMGQLPVGQWRYLPGHERF